MERLAESMVPSSCLYWSNMQTQINKGSLLKWILISCGIIFVIAVANILTIPLFISSDYVKNKITHTIEDRLKFTPQIGTISFYWPNRSEEHTSELQSH